MDNMFVSNPKKISLSEHPGAAIKQPQSSAIQCKTILVVMDLVWIICMQLLCFETILPSTGMFPS